VAEHRDAEKETVADAFAARVRLEGRPEMTV
jgi:hypothetical protein